MTKLDPNTFLNKTFFCSDVMALLADVKNFLELSEENLERQKKHELQLAAGTVILEEDKYLQYQYQHHLIENARYQYDVSLAQRVRYAGLTAVITTVDWCALGFRKRLTFNLPPQPKNTNSTIHMLNMLNKKAGLAYGAEIDDLESLVHVRNCVVHAAGFVDSYKHNGSLKKAMKTLPGVSLSDENFLGQCIAIDRNALPVRIEAMMNWLPDLDEHCTKQGLFVT